MANWVDWKSGIAGFLAMPAKHGHVNYAVRRNTGWWFHFWTPSYHEGRGPYVSIGLGFFALYRGY